MNQEQRLAAAREAIDIILEDDDRWQLFVKQMTTHGFDVPEAWREQAKTSHELAAYLGVQYLAFSMRHICDWCDYNHSHRKGADTFRQKRVFHCDWKVTQGDLLARETGSYAFSDPAWKAKYQALKQHVVEEHTDSSRPPSWLDVANNLCPHFYQDISRP